MTLATRLFRSDRSCLLLIVPLALVLFVTNLGGRDVWAPDEPRTALITRGILESGSWSVLHEDGHPYLEKPPLTFWLAALASLPGGTVTEFTVRLPSNAAALLGIVCLFYFGRSLFGRRAGALAAIVLATTQEYFMEARWAHPDMLLCLFITTACFAFWEARRLGGSLRWLALFYLALGMAVLTKGPVGLLPLLAALVFLAAVRDLPFLRRAGLWWGVPLALLPIGLWLIAYSASAGEAFPVLGSMNRVMNRMTVGVHHAQPFYHTFTSLLINFVPWVLLLPGAVYHTFPRRGARNAESIYIYSFVATLLVVFAFSAEKRGVYLLPIMPLLALLIGRIWDTALFDWDPSPVRRTLTYGFWAGLVISAGAAGYLVSEVGQVAPDLYRPAVLLSGSMFLAALLAVAGLRRYGGGTALSLFGGGLVLCYLVIAIEVLPAINPLKSARPFSREVAATVGEAPLGIYPDYHASYAFYTGRPIERLPDKEHLEAFFRSAPRAYCLIDEERFESDRGGLDVGLEVLDRARIGHRVVLLVANAGGDDAADGSLAPL